MNKASNSPCATIHLDHIQHNFDLVRQLAPNSRCMIVVKANAYGHGAIEVCGQLKTADAFAVARVSEGIELRQAGFEQDIIILEGFLDGGELQLCHDLQLTPVVHSLYQLALLDVELGIWLKVNTGMNRLGLKPRDLAVHLDQIKQKNILGILSHFANADHPERPENAIQVKVFSEVIETLSLDVDLSFANSDSIIKLEKQHLDWVRPGIMLYGAATTPDTDPRLKGAMTLSAPVIAINELRAGEAIGYGGHWSAKEDCRIAVVGLGYADGYPREMPEGTPVLVNGQRRALVGRISMDMLFVKLDAEDKVAPGQHLTFWGPELPISEVASHVNTVSYTLMTGLTPRVKKIYSTGPGAGIAAGLGTGLSTGLSTGI